jgi:uncharacterized phage protein (TIGR02218 family)
MSVNLAAVKTYLDGGTWRPTLIAPNCYTFYLQSDATYRVTSADIDVVTHDTTTDKWRTFSSKGIRVNGLRMKLTIGLEADEQDLAISALPTDTIVGVPFLLALRNGLFDAAHVEREYAFLPSWGETAIGTKTMFYGHVSQIDQIGRLEAVMKVKTEIVHLDVDMPRNIYQSNCLHTLYDAGCSLNKADFTFSGSIESTPGPINIPWSGATSGKFDNGRMTFTSGALTGLQASIRYSDGIDLWLVGPLDVLPQVGDTFDASWGCDHTRNAGGCGKFNNLSHFRGFDLVPPPKQAA